MVAWYKVPVGADYRLAEDQWTVVRKCPRYVKLFFGKDKEGNSVIYVPPNGKAIARALSGGKAQPCARPFARQFLVPVRGTEMHSDYEEKVTSRLSKRVTKRPRDGASETQLKFRRK